MKNLFTFLATVLLTASVFAQSPEKMSYQAVVRDEAGNLVTEQKIGMQISILQGSENGAAVYVESQTPTTNANGLVSIVIGGGITIDDFSNIDWGSDSYFIKTESDLTGGTNYTITGTSQILSVPYSLFSKKSASLSKESSVYNRIAKLENLLIQEGILSNIEDVDGNVYEIVKIGNQVWMTENLKVTKYNDNTPIEFYKEYAQINQGISYRPSYCWYDHENNYKDTYGALYNGYAIEKEKICPSGWHVPSKDEFIELINYVGGFSVAGAKLKSVNWSGGTNDYGFSAVPSGRGYGNGVFNMVDEYGMWWSSTDGNGVDFVNETYLWYVGMYNFSSEINDSYYSGKEDYYSVRCLKD